MVGEAAAQLQFLMKPLAVWLDDPATEEVCINRPGELFVRQRGQFRGRRRLLVIRTWRTSRRLPVRSASKT